MKLKNIIPKWLIENSTSTYSYGCVMIYFDFPKIEEIHSLIEVEDLYEEDEDATYGLEDEPHTTILYGLHDDEVSLAQVKSAVTKYTFTDCLIYNPSLFRNEKYDVLKFQVDGDNLHKANAELKALPHTSSFPRYHPHLTIAYLQSGKGTDYVNLLNERGLNSFKLTPSHIIYSQPDGTKNKINIKVF